MTVATVDRRRRPLRWWYEILLAAAFYGLYSMVRNTFGAGSESRSIAFRHARGVIKVEDTLGLWFEPALQQWYLDLPANGFIRGWNIFYGTAHFVVTIGVLVYAFLRAPQVYRFARNVLAGTTLLALVGFAAYTLMPPRLLDAATEYGACAGLAPGCHGYGIVDTIEQWGGIWKFGEGGMADLSNQYAAMPSLHFGWSTWCALTMVLVLRSVRGTSTRAVVRRHWWVFLYPAATLFCILITGNHYWLDAFFGGVALGGGWAIASAIQWWSGRHDRPGHAHRDQCEPDHIDLVAAEAAEAAERSATRPPVTDALQAPHRRLAEGG